MYENEEVWSTIHSLWVKQCAKEMDRARDDLIMLKLFRQQEKDRAVIAAFRKNSSYFMRKDGDPLIFKREGVNKDNIIDWIIMAGKRLDEADVDYKYNYYIPVPDWFEDAVDPL